MRTALMLLALFAPVQAQDATPAPAPAPPAPAAPPSPWAIERGTEPRPAGPLDPVPDVAFRLALLLRDGHVPGFYDGQFASVADRFDELAALASEPDANHVLRVMAVMALQEAGSGEKVKAVLDPLVIPAHEEVDTERTAWLNRREDASPVFQRQLERADLSLHARFALAKDGQPERVREKIREMDNLVHHHLPEALDKDISSYDNAEIAWYRDLIFDIGYHFQQFDDYDDASEWFHLLTDELPGHGETAWAHYDLACISALQGHPEDAVEHLRAAFAVGFTDARWMLEDGDLKSLRDRPDFKALADQMRAGGEAVVPEHPPQRPGSIGPH